jgi:hypothetical protein
MIANGFLFCTSILLNKKKRWSETIGFHNKETKGREVCFYFVEAIYNACRWLMYPAIYCHSTKPL